MAIHIRRREFIVTLGSAAAAWPLAARAQQSAIPVVGYLGVASAQAEAYLLAPFRKGLSEAGFDEGRNVTIDYRFAERDVSRLPALAAELVRRKVTVVYTATTRLHARHKGGDLDHSHRVRDRRPVID